MAEIIALYIVCRNIGAIARSHGLPAQPFQFRAILLWIAFEFAFALIAGAVGLQGIGGYLAAFVGALISLFISFGSVHRAALRRGDASRPSAHEAGLTTEISKGEC